MESIDPEEVEEVTDFMKSIYELLAAYLPGDTTLNELRVLTAVALASKRDGKGTSVSEIADETGISRATVSRLIAQWTEADQIREDPHPSDGRRRILGFTEKAHSLNREWSTKMWKVMKGVD